MNWDAVNARARGLATHLLSRDALRRAARCRSVPELALRLSEAGSSGAESVAPSATELDRAIGRTVAARFRLLARWLGPRREVLSVVLEEEDRRSLRGLLRGAAGGIAPVSRLRGLNPTPSFTSRQLERLAAAESPAALAEELRRQGHPAGRALQVGLADPRTSQLGLIALEAELGRLFATRATRAARRGGPLVRAMAAQSVDLANAAALLAAGSWGRDVVASDLWLPGGTAITREAFGQLLKETDAEQVARALRQRLGATALGAAFRDGLPAPADLERRVLAARIAWLRVEARRNPLGPAVVLGVLLRILAEAQDVRTVLAGLGLGAPAPVIEAALAEAA